jgi:hypothetical protein
MPNQFEEVLKQLVQKTEQTVTKQSLENILKDMGKEPVPMDQLQKFMMEKFKGGQQRLMQLVQSQQLARLSPGDSNMGEMLTLLGQVGAQVQASPSDALNTLMLLYLPWYPLQPPHEMRLSLGGQGDEDGENTDESAPIHLYIQTAHLGKMKGMFFQKTAKSAQGLIECEPELKPHQKAILKQLTQELARTGLTTPEIFWEPMKGPEKIQAIDLPEQSRETIHAEKDREGRELMLFPSQGVPVIVVQTAYCFAKLIFEIDEHETLLTNRQAKTNAEDATTTSDEEKAENS